MKFLMGFGMRYTMVAAPVSEGARARLTESTLPESVCRAAVSGYSSSDCHAGPASRVRGIGKLRSSVQRYFSVMRVLLPILMIACCTLFIVPSSMGADLPPLLQDALEEHKARNYKKAIELYTEAIQKNQFTAEALNWRGMAYAELNQLDKALSDYNEALKQSKRYADAYNNRGEVYRRQGKLAEAMKDYEKAVKHEPKFAEAYFNRGLVREAKGKYHEAAKDLLTYVKMRPEALDKRDILFKIKILMQKAPEKKTARATRPAGSRSGTGVLPGQTPKVAQAPGTKPDRKLPGAGLPGSRQPGLPGVKDSRKAPPGAPSMPGLPPEAQQAFEQLPISPEQLMAATVFLSQYGAILGLVLHLFFGAMLFLIARKTGTPMPWLAFIPILQLLTMVQIAGKAWWWFLLILIVPLINIILYLIVCIGIARARNKSALWGILLFIPCTAPLALLYLALTK